MKKIIILSVALFASCITTIAWAQSGRAWRCPGNHYTNDAAEARKLGGCTLIEDRLTVVNGKSSRGRSSTGSRVTGSTSTTSSPSNMQVSTEVQGVRDSDARKLIETELNKKQAELGMLQGQYNNGQPEKLPSEVSNEVAYQERAGRMNREIEKKVAEITAIQNELARLR